MLKKIDEYIQQKINSIIEEKLPKNCPEEREGFFFIPDTNRNSLLAKTLQKTQEDVIPRAIDGTVMDGVSDSASKLNSAYAIYGQVNDIIYTHFAQQGFIGFQACALLAQNWLINKCCILPPKDAMAPDYEISYKSKDIKQEDKEILSELKKVSDSKDGFKIKEAALEFAEMKRVFGVAYAYPLVDGVNYEIPFNLNIVKSNKYKGMVNVDPYWLTPELDSESATNTASPDFYEPTWYRLPNGKRLHKSWIIKSINGNLPDILKPTYCYGGYPIPQLVYQRVYAAESVANEAPMLAKSKRLLYMDGNLSNYVLNQNKAENDAKAFSYFRDNWGVVVKRPDQAIGQIDTSLTDFDAVMMSQYQLVAAASGVHATKLLETQPKGFNTSGDFEIAQYNSLLVSIEKEDYQPYLNFHYMLLLKSLYSKEHVIECEFNPIDTPTSKEVAECNEIKSRTNMTYVTAGVISADECRENLRLDPESGFNSLTGEAPKKGKSQPKPSQETTESIPEKALEHISENESLQAKENSVVAKENKDISGENQIQTAKENCEASKEDDYEIKDKESSEGTLEDDADAESSEVIQEKERKTVPQDVEIQDKDPQKADIPNKKEEEEE